MVYVGKTNQLIQSVNLRVGAFLMKWLIPSCDTKFIDSAKVSGTPRILM